MDEIEITILNWEKHQTHSDQVRYPHWFKLKNDIPSSASLFNLTAEQKWGWVCLLAQASKKKSSTITLKVSWFCHISDIPKKVFLEMLDLLEKNEALTVNRELTVSEMHLEEKRGEERRGEERRREEKRGEKEVCTELSANASRSSTSPPEEFLDPVVREFLERSKIKASTQYLWLKTYEDPAWLKQEFLKILAWLDANPTKKPKSNYARFIGSWLSRGWEWHRKALPSNKADPGSDINWDRVFKKGGAGQ